MPPAQPSSCRTPRGSPSWTTVFSSSSAVCVTTVAYADDPYAAYLSLVGKATKVGRAIPPGIAAVVREVVEDPRRREAATVLLLTEELGLPWELAVFDPPLDSRGVGSRRSSAPMPRSPVAADPAPTTSDAAVHGAVRRAAVLAADYAGVPGWNRLDHAIVEARQVAALFAPPAVTVRHGCRRRRRSPWRAGRRPAPRRAARAVRRRRVGRGPGPLAADTGGAIRTAQFLTPDQVETGRLDGGPFVFLNACQVASDKRVLGDYGGFASTLLRIGATGVVAPLWNVDDDVAAEFARRSTRRRGLRPVGTEPLADVGGRGGPGPPGAVHRGRRRGAYRRRHRDPHRVPGVRPPPTPARPRLTTHEGARWLRT